MEPEDKQEEPSFMQCRPYLYTLRVAILHHLCQNVLVVVRSKRAAHISIFRLGYLLAGFYLLLFSTTLLQKDTCTCLLLWDGRLLYNITISKNMLLLLSCIFMKQMQINFCCAALYALSKAIMTLKEMLCTAMTPCTSGQSSRSLPCTPLGISPFITLSTSKPSTSPTKVEAQLIRQAEAQAGLGRPWPPPGPLGPQPGALDPS